MAKTYGSVWDAAPEGMKRPAPVVWDEATPAVAPTPARPRDAVPTPVPVPEPPPAPRWVAVDPAPVQQAAFSVPIPAEQGPEWVEIPAPVRNQRAWWRRVEATSPAVTGAQYDAVWVDEPVSPPPPPPQQSTADRLQELARSYRWTPYAEAEWNGDLWTYMEENL